MVKDVFFGVLIAASSFRQPPIDRQALVSRHDVVIDTFSPDRPVQVGNGEFAFGMDITGLQSFAPFNTMAHWGWNSLPLPPGQKISDFQGQVWDTHGRPVRYPMPDPKHPELSDWLAGNPHAINLGRLGMALRKKDGTLASPADLHNAHQVLDLWHGIVTSRFELEGQPVTVTTGCHPTLDSIAVRIQSPLVSAGRLAVFFDCPEDDGKQFASFVGDQGRSATPGMTVAVKSNRVDLTRNLGDNGYHVSLAWQGGVKLQGPRQDIRHALKIVKAEYGAGDKWADVTEAASRAIHNGELSLHVDNRLAQDPAPGIGKEVKLVYSFAGEVHPAEAPENADIVIDPQPELHRFTLQPDSKSDDFSFVCDFAPHSVHKNLPTASTTFAASQKSWPAFWRSGGAIDFSQSTDPRWKELERRVVLSQYLMAVNEAGSWPPQESGLVNNGWFGRFHLEMYWWHAAHWALWNRWPELNRSLSLYQKLLPAARKVAASEGYKGARWPKCIGPNGREWPHEIHSLLIWQQPHPIFFAELDYRAHPTRATLEKWKPVVEATADFLASYAYFDRAKNRYVLGPPVFVASENTDPKTTQNPTFELGYWRFGLRVAQEWRKRMGLEPRSDWDRVLQRLSPLPQQDGVYVLHEGVKDMWTQWNFEHPALTGVLGILPGDGVDRQTMKRTLDKVSKTWKFERTWGWDYPMLAMCAARLEEPDRAVDFLLYPSDNFQFDYLGLATGGPYPYFPSNGALLYAVAMMAGGWDGASSHDAPGFPKDGRWKVRYEKLSPAP